MSAISCAMPDRGLKLNFCLILSHRDSAWLSQLTYSSIERLIASALLVSLRDASRTCFFTASLAASAVCWFVSRSRISCSILCLSFELVVWDNSADNAFLLATIALKSLSAICLFTSANSSFILALSASILACSSAIFSSEMPTPYIFSLASAIAWIFFSHIE